jgi:histone H3/H4
LQFRKLPFQRLIQEITQDILSPAPSFRWQRKALFALQESAKAFVVGHMEGKVGFYYFLEFWLIKIDCNINAIHAKRVTIQAKDSQLAQRYLQKYHPGNLDFLYRTRDSGLRPVS